MTRTKVINYVISKLGETHIRKELKMPKLKDVTQQKHYTQYVIQPVEYIGKNRMGYMEGNIIKYVSRYNLKGGVEDLHKAQHYLTMLIERETWGSVTP